MAVMRNSVEILKRLETNEEGECNRCLAVEEMRRDWKTKGKVEGVLVFVWKGDNVKEPFSHLLLRYKIT